jgi:hypothetical protein
MKTAIVGFATIDSKGHWIVLFIRHIYVTGQDVRECFSSSIIEKHKPKEKRKCPHIMTFRW